MSKKNVYLQVRLGPDLGPWFKDYAKRNYTTMSAIVAQYVLSLKKAEEENKPAE